MLRLAVAEGNDHGVQVEGDGHILPVDVRQHLMAISTPLREAGQEAPDLFVIGMKDMGAVAVDQHTGFIGAIVGVACDMVPLIHHQHVFAVLGQGTSRNCARHTCAYNNPIVRHRCHPF